jgi:L-ascorbate metabolism protein UlaG (beta-lactamase superfamily)
MTPREAVLASSWLGLTHVIASHYQSPAHPHVKEFLHLMQDAARELEAPPKVSFMSPGEVMSL